MKKIIEKDSWFTLWTSTSTIEKHYEGRREALNLPSYYPGISLTDLRAVMSKSPIKIEFLKDRRFEDETLPSDLVFDRISFGYESPMVDHSGFWFYPTGITFFSRMFIESGEDAVLPVTLVANGSVKLWLNGKELCFKETAGTNWETRTDLNLELAKGRNTVIVGVNDFGERNTMLRFGLINRGFAVESSIPDTEDDEKLLKTAAFINALGMEQSGDDLIFSSPDKAPFDISLSISDDDGNRTEALIREGEERAVATLSMNGEFITASCKVLGVRLRKKFYRFVPARPIKNIAPTEKERKERYIDAYLKEGRPSPALIIAGLSRGLNLYKECGSLEDTRYRVEHMADCADFRLSEIIWAYILGRDILEKETLDEFERLMLGFRYWFDEPGNDVLWFFSENHALALHASEFVVGSLFPDKVFSNSGMTGREHMEKARGLLRAWFSSFFAAGYNEWSSVNYISVDMLGYEMLYKFSDDAEIKGYAKRALDYTFELFALQCHRGVLFGANGRIYPRDLLSPANHQTNAFCHFAWGTPYAPFAYRNVLYALIDYETPVKLESDELVSKRILQGRRNIATVFAKTDSWFFGSSDSAHEESDGAHEQLIDIVIGDHEGRIWINHPGESVLFGTRRPGYFNGNGVTPMVSQYLSSAVVSFRYGREAEEKAEVKFTHLMARRSVFEKVVLKGSDLYLRREGVNVYIHAENGFEEAESDPILTGFELRSPGLWNTWYVRVDDRMEFDEFQSKFNAALLMEKNGNIEVHDPVFGLVKYRLMDPVGDK